MDEFDCAYGDVAGTLAWLLAMVPAAERVEVEDTVGAMVLTAEHNGVRASASVASAEPGEWGTLALAGLRAAIESFGRRDGAVGDSRVKLAPCDDGGWAVTVDGQTECVESVKPEEAGMSCFRRERAVVTSSRPGLVAALRSVRSAARAADGGRPVVTLSLTEVGLTLGGGRGENVTLATAPARVGAGDVGRSGVVPLTPLEVFMEEASQHPVAVRWSAGQRWVIFECGLRSVALERIADASAAAVRPQAFDGHAFLGLVLLDRAALLEALVEEAAEVWRMGLPAETVVLSVAANGSVELITPERRATSEAEPRLLRALVDGRRPLQDVELQCDLGPLRDALATREGDVRIAGEDLVALHVGADSQLVVTAAGCDVDDRAVRRDGVVCLQLARGPLRA
jgi:hypothetical protein